MAPRQSPSDFGLERFMGDAFRNLLPSFHDWQEDERSWTLTLDVPGVSRKDLRVNVMGNMVHIETDKDASRQIRASYQLPHEIDAEHSEAKLEDGVLTLKLAKVESATARQIKVK